MSALTPIGRAILDLVAALSYEGLPCTRYAIFPSVGERFPVLVPNEFPLHRFKCEGGVPQVFLQACVNEASLERLAELFQSPVSGTGIDSELDYLVDRGLLDRFETTYRPQLGSFPNPFGGREILSVIEKDIEARPGFQVRWRVNGGIEAIVVVPDFVVAGPIVFYKLTQAGHDLQEPLQPANPSGGRGDARAGEKRPGILGWVHGNYVAPILVTIIGGIVLLVIVGITIRNWPWIKTYLG